MFTNFFSKKKNPVIGLSLSGGGLRGIGHIGAIKALEEHGFRPSVLSGTSAGAIIGAFYAAGYTPDEMLKIALKSHSFPITGLRLRVSGFMDNKFLVRLFREYIPENSLDKLKIPLYVAVTDIVHGVSEFLHTGELDQALLASAGIPFVFSPVKEGNKVYIDGGILNNLPIEPIKNQCDLLIGVHVNSLTTEETIPLGAGRLLDRVMHLALNNHVYAKSASCQLFIDPPNMTRFSMFEKKDIQHIYDYVYTFTSQQLEK